MTIRRRHVRLHERRSVLRFDPDHPIWTGGFWGLAAEVPALAIAEPAVPPGEPIAVSPSAVMFIGSVGDTVDGCDEGSGCTVGGSSWSKSIGRSVDENS